jgi:hypothetical protein
VPAFRAGDTDAARSAHTEAFELPRRGGDREGQARALGGLVRVALREGDLLETRSSAEEAVATWRELVLDRGTRATPSTTTERPRPLRRIAFDERRAPK